MHIINKVLSSANLQITRLHPRGPSDFNDKYTAGLRSLKNAPNGYRIFEEYRYDAGTHPANYVDYECAFAARHVARVAPQSVLDVGSYRHFIIGMLAGLRVTTIDVRERSAISGNETVLTCDAKQIRAPDASFDAVVSLCALEHFGLGRYGDEFDPDGDKKGFAEMVRVLKPGGRIIFTTTMTRYAPTISYNAHRIYTHEMIRRFCEGLVCEDETCLIFERCEYGPLSSATTKPNKFDIYCGCWRKP